MVELQTTWNVANKSTNKGGLMVIFSKLDVVQRKMRQENGRKRKAMHRVGDERTYGKEKAGGVERV
ncbi:MAG: hypothetical protein MOIL_01417 [Candidatus Methanolliviera sp. GoM_oil]|nr:MAG: hypothetical protein MOIL_01417 [Candidatus Methanolliviera sp. GoM_oil]